MSVFTHHRNWRKWLDEILPENKKDEFETEGETDFNFPLHDTCRFRVNAFHQRGEVSIAARLISSEIPTIEQLGMPTVLYDLANKPARTHSCNGSDRFWKINDTCIDD